MGNAWSLYMNPSETPHPLLESPFDPLLGFPNGRKERVMIATQEEMESAKLPLDARDYCAHLALQYASCRKDVWPFAYKCKHEKNSYLTCEHEDYILRMKEYERARRLMIRENKNKISETPEGEDTDNGEANETAPKEENTVDEKEKC